MHNKVGLTTFLIKKEKKYKKIQKKTKKKTNLLPMLVYLDR